MYKHIFTAIAACLLIPAAAFSVHLAHPASHKATVEETTLSQPAESRETQDLGAVEARLGQLLKLNRVFDNCIDDDRVLIEEAATVLLDEAEETAEGNMVIRQESVLRFIEDLYGRQADPAAAAYDYLPAPEGYFAIPARGYDTYTHEIENMSELDNGNFTVLSKMTVDTHDGESFSMRVITLFAPAPDSPYGYHILRADIVQ